MKKFLKWFLIVLAVLFVLLVVALFFIDEIAKFGIEKIGPKIVGVPMKVEDISIHPTRGRVEIVKMVIGNPEDGGYKTDYAIFLGDVVADVDLRTIFNKKLVIEEFRLKDVQLNYETPVTFIGSNIADILDHLNKEADKEAAEIAEEKAEAQAEGKPQKQTQKTLQMNKMIIDHVKMSLLVKNTSVEIPLIVTLPEIGPMGTTEEGLTPLGLTKEVSNIAYDSLIKTVMKCKDVAIQEFMKASATTVKEGGNLGESALRAGKKLLKTGKDLVK